MAGLKCQPFCFNRSGDPVLFYGTSFLLILFSEEAFEMAEGFRNSGALIM